MFASILYIGAILGIILFGAGMIAFYVNSGRFYGRTLANWVLKTRSKNDESSAEKLIYIKKHLEVLAHDILKHRLFGLDTLTKEMRPYFDKSNPNNVIGKEFPPELIALRDSGEYAIDVKGGGLGCALIRTEVFERLEFPWFEWKDLGYEDCFAVDVYGCTDRFQSGGEDIEFCNACRYEGIRITADARVACGHEFREVKWPE